MIQINTDDCHMCGGSGEVTITTWTEQDSDKLETAGCPLCIQTERDTEIAALKQRIAELELAQAEPVAAPAPDAPSLCSSCTRADVSCPIYPQETQHGVEYRKRQKGSTT